MYILLQSLAFCLVYHLTAYRTSVPTRIGTPGMGALPTSAYNIVVLFHQLLMLAKERS